MTRRCVNRDAAPLRERSDKVAPGNAVPSPTAMRRKGAGAT